MAASRDVILDAVLDVVARDGLQGARMEDVATAAGVSRQLVYYHYRSRQELLAALLDRGLAGLAAAVREAAVAEPVEELPLVVLRHIARNQALCRLLVTEMWGLGGAVGSPAAVAERVASEIIAPVAAWIRADVARGRVACEDAELAARALFGQVTAVAFDPIVRGLPLRIEDLEPPLRALAAGALGLQVPARRAGCR